MVEARRVELLIDGCKPTVLPLALNPHKCSRASRVAYVLAYERNGEWTRVPDSNWRPNALQAPLLAA